MYRECTLIMLIGLFAAALPASEVWAQNQGGKGPSVQTSRNIQAEMRLALLLNNQKVQKELDFTDDQKNKVVKAAAESSAALAYGLSSLPMHNAPQAPQLKIEIDDLRREHEDKLMKKLHEILLPNQLQRLNEIYIQSQGVMALLTPGVIEALALTAQQQKDMKLLNEEFSGKMMNMPMREWSFKSEDRQAKTGYGYGFKSPDPETQKLQANMQKEFHDKLLAILTYDQRDQFEKLKGKKLDIKFPSSNMSMGMQSRSDTGRSAEGSGGGN